jgi:hypothetical protein
MDMEDDLQMPGFGQESLKSPSSITGRTMNGHQDRLASTSLVDHPDGVLSLGDPLLDDQMGGSIEDTIDQFMTDSAMPNDVDITSNDVLGLSQEQHFETPDLSLENSISAKDITSTSHSSSIELVRPPEVDPIGFVEDERTFSDVDSLDELNAKVERSLPSTKVEVVIYAPPDPVLPYSSRSTGLVYDPRMRFHTELLAVEDDLHPEDPRRIHQIYSNLCRHGLVSGVDEDDLATNDIPNGITNVDFFDKAPQRLKRIDARFATREEVTLVHTPGHWDWVEGLESELY